MFGNASLRSELNPGTCATGSFPRKQAGSSPIVTPAPTGQGERKLILGVPAKDGAGLLCHWSAAPAG